MRAFPNEFDQAIIESQRELAPPNGAPFHRQEDFQVFLDTSPEEYEPGREVVNRFCIDLDGVLIVAGPSGIGKNGAINEAIAMSSHPKPRHGVSRMYPVDNFTTRCVEFRDGRVEEDMVEYDFCYELMKNMRLAQAMREKKVVQYRQPRGTHVYGTTIDSFPTSGIAIMDAVPATMRDINRIYDLGGSEKRVIGAYRTDKFDVWMARWLGRGDIIDSQGNYYDLHNFNLRRQEAAESVTEVMDLRHELEICLFSAEERPEAGKAIIDIAVRRHSKEMQKVAEENAMDMLRGLEEAGFKAA